MAFGGAMRSTKNRQTRCTTMTPSPLELRLDKHSLVPLSDQIHRGIAAAIERDAPSIEVVDVVFGGQGGGNHSFPNNTANCGTHKQGLIRKFPHLHVSRDRCQNGGQRFLDASHHIQGRS